MKQRSLIILLEVSPDQIRGGYLRGRLQQIRRVFQKEGWSVTLGAPTDLSLFDGMPCIPVRTKTLVSQLREFSLAVVFLSTHPHWIHLAHFAHVPVLLDASNLPWLERHEWLKRFPGRKGRWLDQVNRSLMDESICIADGVVVSHVRQGEYVVARTGDIPWVEMPFFPQAPAHSERGIPELQKPYFLWGGGLWPWLDYETFLDALRRYRTAGGSGTVVIPVGISEFSDFQTDLLDRIQADPVLRDACVLLRRWLPREAWESVLQGALAGLSCQPDSEETRFAFRTRILDYLRVGLPVLSTEGDALGEFAAEKNAGFLHPFQNAERLAQQMLELESNARKREEMSNAGKEAFAHFLAGTDKREAGLLRLAGLLEGKRIHSSVRSMGRTAGLLAARFLL